MTVPDAGGDMLEGTRLWSSAKALFLAATFALLSAVAAAAQSAEFSGEWQTFWRAGTATLTLTQEGDAVTGSYEPFDGSVTGTIEGRVPSGT